MSVASWIDIGKQSLVRRARWLCEQTGGRRQAERYLSMS